MLTPTLSSIFVSNGHGRAWPWVFRTCLGLCGLASAIPSAQGATYNFFDTTFVNSDWAATKWADTTPFMLATFTAVQQNVGGSTLGPSTPDYRQTAHTYDSGGILVEHRGSNFNWNPLPGEVATHVDFEFDLIHQTAATVGGAVGYALNIYQGTQIYRMPFDNIFANTWQRFTHLTVPLTSFAEIVPGTGAVLPFSNPVGNVAMSFGYMSGNSANQLTTKVSGVDNFNLTLHTIPEPSGLWIVGLVAWRFCRRHPSWR